MINWKVLAAKEPPQDVGLLVRMPIPFPVYDVAVYRGIQPGGERRWILADVSLDASTITHWAEIDDPYDGEME